MVTADMQRLPALVRELQKVRSAPRYCTWLKLWNNSPGWGWTDESR